MKKNIIFTFICLSIILFTGIIISQTYKASKKTNMYHEYHINKVNGFIEENKTLENIDVCFIGDSLTDGYDVKSFYSNLNVINRGIGGDRVKDVITRLDNSVYQARPKVVVILIGGNDVLAGHDENYIIDSIVRIILKIKNNLNNIKIVVQSFYPLSQDYAKHNETMKRLNKVVEEVCTIFNVVFADIYESLLDQSTNELNLDFTPDNVHLNIHGYNVVTSILNPIIDELLA